MKARVAKVTGMAEYFAIKVAGIKLVSPLLGDMELILRFPAGQYDWMEDPEAVVSEIVRRINKSQ